jgi:hypothetical protein
MMPLLMLGLAAAAGVEPPPVQRRIVPDDEFEKLKRVPEGALTPEIKARLLAGSVERELEHVAHYDPRDGRQLTTVAEVLTCLRDYGAIHVGGQADEHLRGVPIEQPTGKVSSSGIDPDVLAALPPGWTCMYGGCSEPARWVPKLVLRTYDTGNGEPASMQMPACVCDAHRGGINHYISEAGWRTTICAPFEKARLPLPKRHLSTVEHLLLPGR